ncbi:MFS transporter [Roseateles sp. BYS96W]|uniref:MFS transporter n=1 Tax=Pelomonas nitida TaxID=3299027 RepID=A0ABW7G246_9BURK
MTSFVRLPSMVRPGADGLAGLALCSLLPALAVSSANVALPRLGDALDARFATLQWIVLAYLLATTALVVGAGRLGDLLGRRRVLLGGVAVFCAASGLCALAPGAGWLIAARAAQGAGAAVMMALPMALVGDVVPKARTGAALGLLGTMSAVGTALGPSLGGLLLAAWGWRALFAVNLPLGLAALALLWRRLPPDQPSDQLSDQSSTRPVGLDLPGIAALALALAAYALAMTFSIWLLVGAAVAAWVFVRVEAQAVSPLLPLASLRDPVLAARLAAHALVSAVMMATLVVGPFHLTWALGLAPASVGLLMSVAPLIAAFSGVPAGRLVDRIGVQAAAGWGLCLMLPGCALLSLLPAALGPAAYVGPLLLIAPGYALFQAANNTAVMAGAASAGRGLAAALISLARNLGLMTGASLMAGLFAAAAAAGGPAAAARGTRWSFAAATGLVVLAWLLVAGIRRRRLP